MDASKAFGSAAFGDTAGICGLFASHDHLSVSVLWKLDACGQAELVRKREVTSTELVEAAIARIEQLNPRVNAVVTPLFDRALAQASAGIPAGSFAGVPLLLKDFLCETAGDPYYEGSRFLRDLGWHSPADSDLATRFRRSGFVILGKTNLPEFAASATTEPAAFGPTRNPWNPERSAGGSSGGSAAAVASGMVPVAHANDGNGIDPNPGCVLRAGRSQAVARTYASR